MCKCTCHKSKKGYQEDTANAVWILRTLRVLIEKSTPLKDIQGRSGAFALGRAIDHLTR